MLSGLRGDKRNLDPYRESKSGHPARSLVSILTEAVRVSCLCMYTQNHRIIVFAYVLWHDAWTPEMFSQRSAAETSIARQRFGKHISKVMLTIIEWQPLLHSKSLGTFPWQRISADWQEMLETVISIRVVRKLWKGTRNWFESFPFGVVGGDEKGSLESGTVKYGLESHGTRIRE
jgi:hypothetical protein